MSTSYNAQIGGGKYKLQFETDNQRLFKCVEKVVQLAVDSDCVRKQRKINKCMEQTHTESLNCLNSTSLK